MIPVPIDPELLAKLTSNGGQVPLTDASGAPVGYFLSPAVYESVRRLILEHARGEVTLTEFRRALADPKRHTMDDVLKLLEGE